ncbi:MAG TPA: SDR family oxidoreductase [Microthrixaceae bacterium]|nr:SDR family oxidoreductase [Microthrixaceae bacterium]
MSKGVCVITGGGRGIGAATARRVAADGWTVCLSYVSERGRADAVASEIGGRAVRADSSSEQDIGALFAAADELGPVTAVVANAAFIAPARRLDEMDADEIRRTLEVNVVGVMLTARAGVRRMSTRHGGSGGAIVTVSSIASRLGSPGEYVDYAASKGAVNTFTIGLARELAREQVRVNAVLPGLIDTESHARGGRPERIAQMAPQIPFGRAGTADEVASAIAWLLGDGASYVTGAQVDVGGGR